MPDRDLNVTILPLDIAECDPGRNLAAAGEAIAALPGAPDLIVVPELFTSGYVTDRTMMTAAARTGASATLDAIGRWARERDAAICGSFVAESGATEGAIVNRGFIATPDGSATFYDKRHLFSPGGENRVMTAGTQRRPVVDFRSWRLSMAICYDIRFPAWMRNSGLEYDCLVVPANWADARAYAWRQLLIARAIENQAYVLGANRSGSDRYGAYSPAESYIFDFMGRDAGARDAATGAVSATLSAEKLNAARERFAVWHDADSFTLD